MGRQRDLMDLFDAIASVPAGGCPVCGRGAGEHLLVPDAEGALRAGVMTPTGQAVICAVAAQAYRRTSRGH